MAHVGLDEPFNCFSLVIDGHEQGDAGEVTEEDAQVFEHDQILSFR